MKLADKIKYRLIGWCSSSSVDIVLPNFYWQSYEMDVFKLMKSGYVVEYEIKISRADFKADFKKEWNETNNKHNSIKNGKRDCNRFFFVVPKNLIKVEEVPDYCGLIYYDEKCNHLYVVKNAPLIHKNKIKEEKYIGIAWKLSFREQNARGKNRRLKIDYDELYERNKYYLEIMKERFTQKEIYSIQNGLYKLKVADVSTDHHQGDNEQ